MRFLLLFISIFVSQNAFSSTLKLDYSLFFGYMKTLYKLDYQDVTTAFYLVQPSGESCTIKKAELVVDEKRDPIEFQSEGRLLPFFSDQHRKDGGVIYVTTAENQNCALQVTLMAKESQLDALTFAKLTLISEQLEGVLRKNAGMIGRYFLPTYQGLRFKLASPISADSALKLGYSVADNGDLLISNKRINATQVTELIPYQVLRITPWIVK
ncbi:DUF2987 domain-containing protein [Psychromonas sp. psych-6C06]|uniref:DUF2987 domain-containing protein n=1 Tax=Psychromonas sp. psych-6C06 TaxID=2058089 RepID=UPI000C31D305|nr:DUF2987 domain-containing protein [Psychromonas sp. psych-6C06]PKF63691.1 DUF2987 domain-containing protein [Psychromonas sp. psych-6C06]